MKKLVAVPCFNEAETLEKTLNKLLDSKKKQSFDILVCNDGSTDSSEDILKNYENKILVIKSKHNKGLSSVFNSILYFAKQKDYDNVLIFDADEQYPVEELENMYQEFNQNDLDVLIGIRNFSKVEQFSTFKKILQVLGSRIVSIFLPIRIKDCTSGFRIYSSKAMELLFSTNNFSYTVETLFQIDNKKLKIGTIEISNVNKTRKSVLFSTNYEYLKKTLKIIIKSIALYKSNIYFKIYIVFSMPGFFALSRFFVRYFKYGANNGNIQSLFLGSIYIATLTLMFLFALLFINLFKNQKMIELQTYLPKHT